MRVALVEPYYTGSHKQWCDGLVKFSSHCFDCYTLRGKYWKWRMRGGAIPLAEQMDAKDLPDIILASDMLDLALFKSLLPASYIQQQIPLVLYFHENQFMYPWKSESGEERDRSYAFINYSSALVADQLWFSSHYQMNGFINELTAFLKAFPDNRGMHNVKVISEKSRVIPVGLGPFPDLQPSEKKAHTLVWNHRHEHDKNPELFFELLFDLSNSGKEFDLVVLGEAFSNAPDVFDRAKEALARHIVHWGHTDKQTYWSWLQKATIAPVTSGHDFFGISVLECAAMGVLPILPEKLVYPEHFFGSSALFYGDKAELANMLVEALDQPWHLRENIVKAGRKYEWKNVVSLYDEAFDSLKAK